MRRSGLGLIERRAFPGETVRRAYCLRCGAQVAVERRDTDADWWVCRRGCNTRFASTAPYPTDLPRPDTAGNVRRFNSR